MAVYGFRDGKFNAKKISVKNKMPVTYSIPIAAGSAAGTASLVAGWDIHAATTAKLAKHMLVQPPYPCVVTVQSWAAGSAGHTDRVKVRGYDAMGTIREEYVYVAATAKEVEYSNYAFGKIISLTPSNTAGILPKSTDINIGVCPSRIGLPYPIATSADIISYTVNSACATTAPYTISATYDTLKDSANIVTGASIKILYLSAVQ